MKKWNYYNEFDPKAAAWIRELISAKLIPDGEVDTRSILDVQPDDVRSYRQCHFFAGIGGWALAFYLAGIQDEEAWSGSCPCPPFSAAGKKQRCECGGKPVPHPLKTGVFACVTCAREWKADERHLWPEFYRLIKECRPPKIYGEQVSGADGLIWLAGVRATMEAIDYGFGCADLCAAGVRAPHIRQRLFWVAYSDGSSRKRGLTRAGEREVSGADEQDFSRMADSEQSRLQGYARHVDHEQQPNGPTLSQTGRTAEERSTAQGGAHSGVDHAECIRAGQPAASKQSRDRENDRLPREASSYCGLADSECGRLEMEVQQPTNGNAADGEGRKAVLPGTVCATGRMGESNGTGSQQGKYAAPSTRHGSSTESASSIGGMDTEAKRPEMRTHLHGGMHGEGSGEGRDVGWMGHTTSDEQRRDTVPGQDGERQSVGGSSSDCRMADAEHPERRAISVERGDNSGETSGRHESASGIGECGEAGGMANATNDGSAEHEQESRGRREGEEYPAERSPIGCWEDFEFVPCQDGKSRRIESGTLPLAHGLPPGMVPSGDPSLQEVKNTGEARVMRLRGYGNAIVPLVAAEFIIATEQALNETTL